MIANHPIMSRNPGQNFTSSEHQLVTVVIPTHNRLPLLLEAIDSVKSQTYPHWELIIIDDASTDGTAETIRRINDPNIHIIELTRKAHLGVLRNEGTARARGEWVAFLDSDDLWKPKKLELQLEILNKEKKRWAYGGSELMDENKNTIPHRAGRFLMPSGWIAKQIVTTEADFHISSIIVEKKLFDELDGFTTDPLLFCREDHEFTLRLAMHAEAAVVPEKIVRTREHGGRTTNSLSESFERSARVYTAFLKYNRDKTLKKLALRRRAYHLSEASASNFLEGKYNIALKQIFLSFKDGDGIRHWLSACKRGSFAIMKKYLRYFTPNSRTPPPENK